MDEITSDKIFEIIGVYFANCYWNNLYTLAQENWKEGKYKTIQDAYSAVIDKYSKAFRADNDSSDKKHYDRIIKDLYINYREYLHSRDTLIEFIDRVSKFLLPYDYYKTLTPRDPKKDTIFRNILTKSVARFTIFLSRQEVEKVTTEGNRLDRTLMIEWKKKFVDIIIRERDEFCTLLMAQTAGISLNQDDNLISKEICDRLREKIRDLMEEKAKLVKTVNDYAKYINVLKSVVQEKDKLLAEMEEEMLEMAKQQKNKKIDEPKPIPVIPKIETHIKTPENKALTNLKEQEFSDEDIESDKDIKDPQVLNDYVLEADD